MKYLVDPGAVANNRSQFITFPENASTGVPKVVNKLLATS